MRGASSPPATSCRARGKGAPRSRAGGRATSGKSRLASRLGLRHVPDDAAFAPYKRAASSFRRAQCGSLASAVGGGYCGPAPSSMVASAALQLAWSRYFSDVAAGGGDPELALTASRLADASRQNLLAAHELCAREAKARPGPSRLDQVVAEMTAEGASLQLDEAEETTHAE
jgi:hypothetical protein